MQPLHFGKIHWFLHSFYNSQSNRKKASLCWRRWWGGCGEDNGHHSDTVDECKEITCTCSYTLHTQIISQNYKSATSNCNEMEWIYWPSYKGNNTHWD